MSRVLVLFAHPALEKSRIHRRLIERLPDRNDITFHDLYEQYPSFSVDVKTEQSLLSSHDLVVLQHPVYWYSVPALLKQWVDLVLEHGWAYGSTGDALKGKRAISVVTAGGRAAAYRADGYNRFTIRQFLAPIEQTCLLCGMGYWPPYVVYGAHSMTEADIDSEAQRYRKFLELLADDRIDFDEAANNHEINPLARALTEEGGVT